MSSLNPPNSAAPDFRSRESTRQGALILKAAIVLAGLSGFYGVVYAFIGKMALALTLGGCALVLLLGTVLFKNRSFHLALTVMAGYCVGLLACAMDLGGLSSAVSVWLLHLPMLALAFSSANKSSYAPMIAGIVAAAVAALLWAIAQHFPMAGSGISASALPYFELVQWLGACLAMGGMGWMFLADQHRLLRQCRMYERELKWEKASLQAETEFSTLEVMLSQRELVLRTEQLEHTAQKTLLHKIGVNIADELRQPLTAIGGALFVAHESPESLSPKMRQAFRIIDEAASRMTGLVSNIHKLSSNQIAHGVPFLVGHNLDLVLANHGPGDAKDLSHVKKGIWESGNFALGDPAAFRYILKAVLAHANSAAIENMAVRSPDVWVSTWQRDGLVTVRIEDSGAGFSRDEAQNVFSPSFSTHADGEISCSELALAKIMADRIGAKLLLVQSTLGGAAFELQLPECPKSSRLPKPDFAPGMDPMNVLVVDDDVLIRTVLKAMLESCGCTVTLAEGSLEAWHYLQEHEPDLLITDFMMPEMNGEDLLLALKQQGFETPTVVLTGGAIEMIAPVVLEAGAMACIGKPLTRAKIQTILDEARSTAIH